MAAIHAWLTARVVHTWFPGGTDADAEGVGPDDAGVRAGLPAGRFGDDEQPATDRTHKPAIDNARSTPRTAGTPAPALRT